MNRLSALLGLLAVLGAPAASATDFDVFPSSISVTQINMNTWRITAVASAGANASIPGSMDARCQIKVNGATQYNQVITIPPTPAGSCNPPTCSGCTCSGGGAGYCKSLTNPSTQCVCAGCGGSVSFYTDVSLADDDVIQVLVDVDNDLAELDETNNTDSITF